MWAIVVNVYDTAADTAQRVNSTLKRCDVSLSDQRSLPSCVHWPLQQLDRLSRHGQPQASKRLTLFQRLDQVIPMKAQLSSKLVCAQRALAGATDLVFSGWGGHV